MGFSLILWAKSGGIEALLDYQLIKLFLSFIPYLGSDPKALSKMDNLTLKL